MRDLKERLETLKGAKVGIPDMNPGPCLDSREKKPNFALKVENWIKLGEKRGKTTLGWIR